MSKTYEKSVIENVKIQFAECWCKTSWIAGQLSGSPFRSPASRQPVTIDMDTVSNASKMSVLSSWFYWLEYRIYTGSLTIDHR